jgi:hypothetical protein
MGTEPMKLNLLRAQSPELADRQLAAWADATIALLDG